MISQKSNKEISFLYMLNLSLKSLFYMLSHFMGEFGTDQAAYLTVTKDTWK